MLDIDRGVDVDARRQQLLNILPALGVPTAWGIAVGQFVHQHQLHRGAEQTVEVHLFKLNPSVFGAQQWLLRQAVEQRLGFGPAVGFDYTGEQLYPLAQLRVRGLQHGVGFAHTRRRAEKHLESATTRAG